MRRPGGRPYPKVRLSGAQPSESFPFGSVPGTEYQWGTHAEATHAYEAAKSQVWRSVRTAVATGLGAFITAAPQVYADIQPVVFKSVRAGQRPPVLPFVSGAPQQVDLTQQANISVPLPGRQGKLGAFITGGPQQIDSTQQAEYAIPTPARQGAVPPFTAGAPQQADLTLQADISTPLPARQGPVPPFQAIPPQADSTQIPARVWSSVRTPPPVASQVPGFTIGFGEEQAYITAYVLEAVGGSPPAPASFVTGAAQADPTQPRSSVWSPGGQAPTPKALGAYFATTPQFEERPGVQVFRALVRGQTPPVIPFVTGTPQQVDLTQQAVVFPPAVTPPVVSYALRTIVGAPQQIDLTQQGWVRGTVAMPQGKPPPFITGGPQADPTQTAPQPSVWAGAPPAAVAPPNQHRLVIDIATGRLGWIVSQIRTGSPIEVIFF